MLSIQEISAWPSSGCVALFEKLVSGLALHDQEKTGLEQETKAGLLVGGLYLVGLLHVVAVMSVVVNAVMTNMMMDAMMTNMMMTMMLCHRGRIGACRTDDR
ncbi:hypothetical protein C1D09_029830, partial [Mesorhizobium intechi]